MQQFQTFAQSESTANRRQVIFKLVDRTDNLTPETGVVFAAGEIQVSKNGAAFVNAAGAAAELAGGFYRYEFTAAELDALGNVRLKIDDAAAAIVVMEFEVRTPAQVYGHLYDGAIWIDTAFGAAGSVIGVNGTKSNPVTNATDARTLADALGRRHYKILSAFPGVEFTFTADHEAWLFEGVGVGAQDLFVVADLVAVPGLAASTFKNCTFTGDLANTGDPGLTFEDCTVASLINIGAAVTLRGDCTVAELGFVAGGTLTAIGNIHGSGPAELDLGAVGVVEVRGASGSWAADMATGTSSLIIDFALPGTVDLSGTGGNNTILNPQSVNAEAALNQVAITPGAALLGLYPDDAVYIGGAASSAGSSPGINGTPNNPCSVLADALSLLTDLNLARLKVFDSATPFALNGDVSGLEIESVAGFARINLDAVGGGVFDATTIRRCTFEGNAGASSMFIEECISGGAFTWEGVLQMRNCIIQFALLHQSAKFAQILFARDCEFLDATAIEGAADIDFQGNSALVLLYGVRGKIRLINNTDINGIDNLISLAEGAQLIIAASSVGNGIYNVSGNGAVIDETVAGANIVLNALLDQVGSLGKSFRVVGAGTTTTVPIVTEEPAGAFKDLRVRVTDVSGAVTEERIVKTHTKPVADQDDALLTLESPLSFVPITGDEIVVRYSPDESLLENALLDQRVYEDDGLGQLQVTARLSKFANGADAVAAVKDTSAGPGTPHAKAIKTIRVTSDRVPAAPGQPDAHRQVKE